MKRLLLMLFAMGVLAQTAAAADIFRVDKVINGHTLLLSNNKTVSLIGIDTDQAESDRFLRDLVEGKGVKLEFDEQRQDAQGNWQAYVLLIETNLNATMVYAGYAVPKSTPPNTMHDELFEMLYRDAVEHKRGLWAKR
ncbi:MAG: thermonuclease family protein [Candidatus Omnitrophica bacterium]|nr:thermonuclease family protein [Candidatus Omnitrophota bacterium]